MTADTVPDIQNYHACETMKTLRWKPTGLIKLIVPSITLRKISHGYLGHDPTYTLVATDNTTRFAIVKATDKVDAQTAKFILENILP